VKTLIIVANLLAMVPAFGYEFEEKVLTKQESKLCDISINDGERAFLTRMGVERLSCSNILEKSAKIQKDILVISQSSADLSLPTMCYLSGYRSASYAGFANTYDTCNDATKESLKLGKEIGAALCYLKLLQNKKVGVQFFTIQNAGDKVTKFTLPLAPSEEWNAVLNAASTMGVSVGCGYGELEALKAALEEDPKTKSEMGSAFGSNSKEAATSLAKTLAASFCATAKPNVEPLMEAINMDSQMEFRLAFVESWNLNCTTQPY
jgi:hypothetical protein